jgi:hypothetical protein
MIDERYEFGIRLLIKHPDIDPVEITRQLGLAPDHSWKSGTQRKTPDGGKLPGVYKESMWNWSNRITGQRNFFQAVDGFAEDLLPHKNWFLNLSKTGGYASLIVNLSGDTNIGADLRADTMKKLLELNIVLGVEVFP